MARRFTVMEYLLNMKKTCRGRNPLPWFLTLFAIVSSQSSQPRKELPESPTPLKLKLNGSVANLSWTNSGRLEEKIHNYTIIYCYPCSNCTTTGRVDGINGNASTYKLHLPVNNTCYEIKMISCTLSSCRMCSDSITQDIKAGLAIRHGNSSGETTTSNDQSIRCQPSFYASVSVGVLLLVLCAVIFCYFGQRHRKNKRDSSHSSSKKKVCCTAEVRVKCGTVTASEEDTSSNNSNSMTEGHVNSGAALYKTDTRSKDTIAIDITEDHGDCSTKSDEDTALSDLNAMTEGHVNSESEFDKTDTHPNDTTIDIPEDHGNCTTVSDEPAESVRKRQNHPGEDNKSTRVVESQSKTITKVQIHKNKNREEHLDMDSLGGLMDKAKEVHPRSNEGDNCKEDKEEIKREDLKQKEGEDADLPPDPLPDPPPPSDHPSMRPRALTEFQIIKLSHRMTNVDWDSLAGLMDIPYKERETIKMDSNFPDPCSKAKRMLSMINEKCDSNRNLLKCLDKMERADFKEIMKEEDSVKHEVEHHKSGLTSSNEDNHKPHIGIDTSKLTPREMHRLSRRVGKNWNILAGYLAIPEPDVQDIRLSQLHPFQTSKAEKALHLYNTSVNFNRSTLAFYLGEMNLVSVQEDVIRRSLQPL